MSFEFLLKSGELYTFLPKIYLNNRFVTIKSKCFTKRNQLSAGVNGAEYMTGH